ncbi:ATP-binding protein [Anaerotignum sp.]
MTNRIFRSIFLVAVAVMLSVSALIMGMMYQYSSAEMTEELQREASYIARGIEMEGIDYLEKVKNADIRITWIDADGTVLYDSVAEVSEMENHGTREEVVEAMKNGEGESKRNSSTLSERTIYYAMRLGDGRVLRLAVETMSILALFFTMAFPLVLILAAMVGVSLFLAFRTAKNITSPMNEIDLEHPDRAEVYEELTPLLRRIAVQNREINRQMAELKRRKEEFDTITANMQEGLLVLDGKGDILSYNEGVLRLLGISHVEEGKNIFSLNRSAAFRRGVEGALAGEHREERLELNGKICQIFVNPVFRDGETAGVILILFDATEKEERERLRREFTANVSHELKTPLTSISGFAEIMKSGIVPPEDMGNFAGKIYGEAQRLIDMIQDIIKLSKLDEKDSILEKEPVAMDTLVLEVCERLQPQAEKQQVKLAAQTEPLQFYGVKQVLTEMVYNLCDNAIRYNKPHGEVRLTLKKEGENLILEVADTGIGIAKEEQDRIFERFYRVDASRSAESGGTGLGLSIVKHGAALHDGNVSMESEIGKGTKMRICLPLNQKIVEK